ncbi:hypothetical protein H8S90_21225 [Olivibacter sp. SDN3]|uniref:hypothetical protein n=1 Tax=Olivibacter sp. SDN3 TaxID=2764720 RepID=UPI0016515ADB|nr:hypothetical protein [Olivibacter sp. SDN3]QNL49234.1 hypothetical protein H8S90_21225 [Olivibacter sp. SDN3]
METKVYSLREAEIIAKVAATLTAVDVLTRMGAIKPDLTKQEAYRIYGEANVNRWLGEKKITKRQSGKNKHWRLERLELEAARQGDVKISKIGIM